MDTPLDPAPTNPPATTEPTPRALPRLRPLPTLKLAALVADSKEAFVCAIDDPDCVSPAVSGEEDAR